MSRINHRGWYLYDQDERILWIVPPKCGSTSFSAYFPDLVRYEGKKTHPWDRCMMVVRHPYERLMSALNMHRLPFDLETIQKQIDSGNFMFWNYQRWAGDRWEQVEPLPLEQMNDRYPDYPHEHRREHPAWNETDIDWDAIYHVYQGDFALCPSWSR